MFDTISKRFSYFQVINWTKLRYMNATTSLLPGILLIPVYRRSIINSTKSFFKDLIGRGDAPFISFVPEFKPRFILPAASSLPYNIHYEANTR